MGKCLPRVLASDSTLHYFARLEMSSLLNSGQHQPKGSIVRFVDLFCGIGGFRVAMNRVAPEFAKVPECVLSSDIDEQCQRAYEANFGDKPNGDIRAVHASAVPDHDLLLAGFPCQPFSIIGQMRRQVLRC